jgi:hypothetical protein
MNKQLIASLVFCGTIIFTFARAMDKQANGKYNDANDNCTNLQEVDVSTKSLSLLQSSEESLEKFTQLSNLILCKNNLKNFKKIYYESLQRNLENWERASAIWNNNNRTLQAKILTMCSSIENIHAGFWQKHGKQYYKSNPRTTLDEITVKTGFIDITNDEEITNESHEVIKRNILRIDKSKELNDLLTTAREIKNHFDEIDRTINPIFVFGAQK